jgi:hypothetical protein
MKIETIDLGTLSLDADAESVPFYIGHMAMVAVQFVVTGNSPTGTFKIQGSCDEGKPNATAKANQYAGVENFSDILNAEKAITDEGTYSINVADPGYLWAKVVYTHTSGDGDSATRVSAKGV